MSEYEGFERVLAISRKAMWPGIEEGASYGTPALKVKGKLICRWREPNVLVLRMDMDEKEILMQAAPEIYFQTDHYRDYPAVLIRLEAISDDELTERLDRAWRRQKKG